MYICKFVFLYIGSGKGFLKKVNLGGPVEGGLPKNKNPTKQGAGWEKMENIKNQTKKCILYTIQGYLAILKTTHLYRV